LHAGPVASMRMESQKRSAVARKAPGTFLVSPALTLLRKSCFVSS
jgi:hypothetical protein